MSSPEHPAAMPVTAPDLAVVDPVADVAGSRGSRWRRHRGGAHNWTLIAGAVLGLLILGIVVFHSAIEPYPPGANQIADRLRSPSWHHLFGTDEVGRDEFSRILAGFPTSLGVSGIAVAISVSIGTALGLIGAAWPGWPRYTVRRAVDFGIAFPFLVIAVVIIVVVGHGFWALSITLGSVTWPIFARVTLAEGIVASQQEYVLAARLMGMGTLGRMWQHMLPAMRQTILVMVAFMFADLILLEAALSFLGLGAPIGTPDWGDLLYGSEQYLVRAPWLLAAPAGAIVLTVITANLLGDGLARRTPGGLSAGSRRRRIRLLGRGRGGGSAAYE